VSREEIPAKFKTGHIDPAEVRQCTKGFDPADYGWDPKGPLATEFRKCRKRATAPPTNRFLFPETTAQENGWCLKVSNRKNTSKLPSVAPKTKLEGIPEAQIKATEHRQEVQDIAEKAHAGSGLGKWASASQMSATVPTELSCVAPSCLSSVVATELSRASSFPGFDKEFVKGVRALDARVDTAMRECRRYGSYGDVGNKRFCPLGETDATAYANSFIKATQGVPPHKWDPRA
jgi:hypothetical protein